MSKKASLVYKKSKNCQCFKFPRSNLEIFYYDTMHNDSA